MTHCTKPNITTQIFNVSPDDKILIRYDYLKSTHNLELYKKELEQIFGVKVYWFPKDLDIQIVKTEDPLDYMERVKDEQSDNK